MQEILQTFLITIKQNKLKLLIIWGISLLIASINFFNYKPSYISTFEMAPYFEIASDLGQELQTISTAINDRDKAFLTKNISNSFNFNTIKSAYFFKKDKGADYSFKHKNIGIVLELSDSVLNLKSLDQQLISFCDNYVKDSIRSYRGIEVWKEKIKRFSQHESFLDSADILTSNFYKSDLSKQNIFLSDSLIKEIILAQTIGEYKSAFKNNYYKTFHNTIKHKKEEFSLLETYLLIGFIPVIVSIILLRSLKYDH